MPTPNDDINVLPLTARLLCIAPVVITLPDKFRLEPVNVAPILPKVTAEIFPACILFAYSVVLMYSTFIDETLPMTVKLPCTNKLLPIVTLPPKYATKLTFE